MRAFTLLDGLVAPLDRANVDTDAIIPKQFLKSIKRSGFGPNLFDEWRYLDHGEPGQDTSHRPINPDFVLNQPRYQGAQVLLARENFGCGSSREHAPWALRDLGIRCIIAPSFGEIFYNNCFKNGILPIVVSPQDHERAMAVAESAGEITIDLPGGVVRLPTGGDFAFAIDARRRDALVNGWDEIDLIATHHAADIDRFEAQQQQQQRWLWQPVPKKG